MYNTYMKKLKSPEKKNHKSMNGLELLTKAVKSRGKKKC